MVRVTTPRIAPLDPDALGPEAQKVMGNFKGETPLNIFRTLAQHPDLLRRWLVFANHVLGKSSLAPRPRELAILRIGWLCRSAYEWGQHVEIGRDCGLTEADIQALKAGPEAGHWDEEEQWLLRAVDELYLDAHISDRTWNALAERWSTQQLMDLVFTVGQYNLVSMALNSFGVQPEPGLPAMAD
jgi:4-carboxymuconolactone decarboxylase